MADTNNVIAIQPQDLRFPLLFLVDGVEMNYLDRTSDGFLFATPNGTIAVVPEEALQHHVTRLPPKQP